MQSPASNVNEGEYLNTPVEEPYEDVKVTGNDYEYIDVDVVVPKDGHHYEHLQHMPSGRTNPDLDSSSSRPTTSPEADRHGRSPQQSDAGAHKACCRSPPCWGWAVLITVLIIAAVLVALLVLFLSSTVSPASLPATSNMTTLTRYSTATLTMTMADGYSTITLPTSTTILTTTPSPTVKNCQEAYDNGGKTSGVYTISPGDTKIQVYCEQELQGGGWTVFQRRMDGTVDFRRTWSDYKRGFGGVDTEYWLGNDIIHLMTVNQDQQLKIELEHGGLTAYADYNEFWIADENGKYQLHVGRFSNGQNNPGDSLDYHNNMYFTTTDRDNDRWSGGNEAVRYKGAWWHNSGLHSNLNALYGDTWYFWNTWSGHNTYLTASRMMIKTK